MSLIIVRDKLAKADFIKAKSDYKSYIKITIDIDTGWAVIGGEYHADAEKLLLNKGGKQGNIWGGGLNLETKQFETNAIINLRPKTNYSTEILDRQTREKFLRMARRIFRQYV